MKRQICSLFIGLLLLGATAPRSAAATQVTESDYKTYRTVQYAKALCEARKMWARGDKAKLAAAEALPETALRDSGWTQDRFTEVDETIGGIQSALNSSKDGEITASELASTLAEFDATAVGIVKAHLAEINQPNDSSRSAVR